ncbi:MAG: PDZ domain-containing protein [candidate division Zixibacteria bacterium]|nr:PDZ domain-containing protein [candidate division Zixibacteria bacterium]
MKAATFMLLIVLCAGCMGVYVFSDPDLHRAIELSRITYQVNHLYAGDLDWTQMTNLGIDAMFERLDRYSAYVEPRQFDRLDEEMTGSYSGIGVSVIENHNGLLIMSVRENGPAASVGLMTGDLITGADSVSFKGLAIEEATQFLRGPEDSRVVLGVFRAATDDSLRVEVTRRKIDFLHIPFAGFTPDSLIYIRLLDFDAGASDDVEAALDSLMQHPSIPPRGVILDMRGNPGGLFVEAYRTANLFLDEGKFIVGTRGRSRWSNERHESSGKDHTGGLPMAVIVDRGSASSTEIVSGALRQLGRAILVGDTTFGKGLVQGFTRFTDGSGIRLTISRYYLEGNLFLNSFDSTLNDTGTGLVPDYFVRAPESRGFPLALESSLLLNSFAGQHQDEIVAASEQFALDDSWVARYADYARSQGFQYRSTVTDIADVVYELASLDVDLPEARRVAERILRTARDDDDRQMQEYGWYIKSRLKELAYERKYGSYRAYAEVIVKDHPIINRAAELLREQR